MSDAKSPSLEKNPLARLLERLGGLSGKEFLLLLLLLAVATRLPLLLTDLLNNDEGGWWIGARILSQGGAPFADFIDNKTPGVYLLYWLPVALGVDSIYPVHVLAIFWMMGVAYLTGEAAGLLWEPAGDEERRRTVARAGALLLLSLSAAGPWRQFLFLNTESSGLLPMAGAMLLYTRARLKAGTLQDELRDLFGAGVLIGVAAVFRQTYVLCLPFMAVDLLWPRACGVETEDEHRPLSFLPRELSLGLGVLAPLALFVLYLVHEDAVQAAWYWLVGANQLVVDVKVGALYHLRRFARNLLGPVLLAFPLWLALAWGAGRSAWDDAARWRLALLWFLVTLGSFATCGLGGRWLGHYYLPVLSPLVAGAVPVLFSESQAKRWRRLAPFSLVLAAAGALAFSIVGAVMTLGGGFEEVGTTFRQTAKRIGELTAEDEEIYVWGFAQGLYYKARRLPASRFIAPNTPISGYLFGAEAAAGDLDPTRLIVPEQWEVFMKDLRERRPALFLDYAENNFHYYGRHKLERYPELKAWLEQNYERLGEPGPIVFYARRDRRLGPPGQIRLEPYKTGHPATTIPRQ